MSYLDDLPALSYGGQMAVVPWKTNILPDIARPVMQKQTLGSTAQATSGTGINARIMMTYTYRMCSNIKLYIIMIFH